MEDRYYLKLLVSKINDPSLPKLVEINVGPEGLVLGRGAHGLSREDHGCSRVHAVLFVDDTGQLKIRDLGSLNGTFVNDVREAEQVIHQGDTLRLGTTRLSVSSLKAPSERTGITQVSNAQRRLVEKGPVAPSS